MKLSNGAWVVVMDGQKRLVLVNDGEAGRVDLRIEDHAEQPSPRTAEQGAERPGRYPGPGARRETVEQTDFHRLAKEAFAADAAALLNAAAAEGRLPDYVLFADPRSLGAVRAALSPAARARSLREVAADCARETVGDIARRVADL